MSKREFYVCDGKDNNGKDCGVILVNETDGRIFKGTVKKPSLDKPIMETGDDERALCITCLASELGIEPRKASA